MKFGYQIFITADPKHKWLKVNYYKCKDKEQSPVNNFKTKHNKSKNLIS